MSTNLPPAWGDESEWAAVTEGTTTTYLRVADFASREDARLFNKFARNDYKLCNMETAKNATHMDK